MTRESLPLTEQRTIHTEAGELPLHEYHLRLEEGEWSILHTGAVLSHEDEQRFLDGGPNRPPYGVALWPAALALAHDVAARADEMRGARVLELGAGTGLPGIIAATIGADVVQTDRHELALDLCRRNGERNGAPSIGYRLGDWTSWSDADRYDWILGSDILYAERLHSDLRRIFERNLATGARILLSDPFRSPSLRLLESMEGDGWSITLSKWNVAGAADPRPIGVFELTAPN
jgi:methyltransferase-like protein 23